MKVRRYCIERIIVEEATEQELEQLVKNGFLFNGCTYFGEEILEKTTEVETEFHIMPLYRVGK